jgi:hypothetical protein
MLNLINTGHLKLSFGQKDDFTLPSQLPIISNNPAATAFQVYISHTLFQDLCRVLGFSERKSYSDKVTLLL